MSPGGRDGIPGTGPDSAMGVTGTGKSAWVLGGLLACAAALCLFGFFRTRGPAGLAGAAVGLAAGASISFLGHALKKRARSAGGPKLLASLLLATFASFGLFILLAVLVGVYFQQFSAPVLLSALAVYLIVLFGESLAERS